MPLRRVELAGLVALSSRRFRRGQFQALFLTVEPLLAVGYWT